MALVSRTLPNLINGVSQQPFALRLDSQAEAQENAYSSVIEGLKKRPPTNHVAKISATALTDAFIHTINRDTAERYVVVITDGDLQVFDLAGVEKTVAFPDGTTYLDAATPKTSFRAVTIADYTFIVNTATEVELTEDLSPDRDSEGLVHIIQGNYGRDYEVHVAGVEQVSYRLPDGADADSIRNVDTSSIAQSLLTGSIVGMGAGDGATISGDLSITGYTVVRIGHVLHIVKNDGSDFALKTEDGFGGNAMKSFKGQVQVFTDLPNKAPEGYLIEVVGDRSSSFDNYWVQFQKENAADEAGTWIETLAPAIPYTFDAATMPHVLVREGDGTFTFRQFEWADRLVGDEESAPEPSFVGRTINDLFFYRNRLGLLADENVIFSEASEFGNFWRTTVTALLDSDPIDVAASHTKVSILRHAVAFDETLLLFSDQTQFVVNSGNLLTPATVSIDPTTEFETSPGTKPIGVGKHVYFAVPRGRWAGIREYFVESDAATKDAADTTAHCPKYIPAGVFKLAPASNEDVLVALTTGDTDAVYAYKFYWSDNGEKLQSSWSRWTFTGDTLLNADFIESTLYLVIQRADGVYLESLSVEAGATDEDSAFLMRLDRKLTEDTVTSVVYDAGNDWTTWTLPYVEEGTMRVVIRAGDADLPEGYVLSSTRPTSSTIRVAGGDYSTSKVIIGRLYEFRYEFSTLVVKEEVPGGGSATIGEGRLQLHHMAVQYDATGYFQVEVTPTFRDPYINTFTIITGSGDTVIGELNLATGRFQWGVSSRNTQVVVALVSTSHLPCAFLSAEWEGDFTIRARRL